MSRPGRRLYAIVVAVALTGLNSCRYSLAVGPLVHIEQIAALPLRVDAPRPAVHLRGWGTLADPAVNVIFIEDGTGAARVDLPRKWAEIGRHLVHGLSQRDPRRLCLRHWS